MERKKIVKIIFVFILLFVLCFLFRNQFFENNEQTVKYSKEKKQLLPKGEWISHSDSLSGISVREDKLAIFENMTFESSDIYKYQIIDSVYKTSRSEKIVGEYLKLKDFSDTIYYQIIKRNDTAITLKMKKGNVETFTLKQND